MYERFRGPLRVGLEESVDLFRREWPELLALDFDRLAVVMAGKVLLDGRNVLDAEQVTLAGMEYIGIGRGQI